MRSIETILVGALSQIEKLPTIPYVLVLTISTEVVRISP